jgi:hypothetical protein
MFILYTFSLDPFCLYLLLLDFSLSLCYCFPIVRAFPFQISILDPAQALESLSVSPKLLENFVVYFIFNADFGNVQTGIANRAVGETRILIYFSFEILCIS